MKLIKKITLSILASLILFSSTLTYASTAHAQSNPWYKQSFSEYVGIVEGGDPSELYGERYAAAQVRWVTYGFFYMILDNPFLGCVVKGPVVGYADCAQALSDVIAGVLVVDNGSTPTTAFETIKNHEFASLVYFKDAGNRWGLVSEAKAQDTGFGFGAAGSVLELWKASRDTTYALLVLVIIILSFMIMFRVKISPQVVISVQSALPKVIFTLILITFSYAIAGLMIDFMYVIIGLIAGILNESQVLSASGNWGELYGSLTNQTSVIALMMNYWIVAIGAFAYAINNFPIITNVLQTGVISTVIVIIVAIVVFILGFKIWWMLLKNFVMILLTIIFGPFQILMGALGGGGGFGPWLKNLAVLLFIYPLVGFMYILSFLFLAAASKDIPFMNDALNLVSNAGGELWPFGIDPANSPLTTSEWIPPLTGQTSESTLVWLGVSLAILALIPKASEIVKGFATGRPADTAGGIAEGLAPFAAAGAMARSAAMSPVNNALTAGRAIAVGNWDSVIRGRTRNPESTQTQQGSQIAARGDATSNAGSAPVGTRIATDRSQGQTAQSQPVTPVSRPPSRN